MQELLKGFSIYLEKTNTYTLNTIQSYLFDVHLFLQYLQQERMCVSIEQLQEFDITYYFSQMKQKNKSKATLARYSVSLRLFYTFLNEQKIVILKYNPKFFNNTTIQNKVAPFVLTVDEVERLLMMPSTHTPKGLRDKAMLELLYATGMLVSELIQSDLFHLHFNIGCIHCVANKKARVIPIHQTALASLHDYVTNARLHLLKEDKDEQALFLNRSGKRMTRQGFWKVLKKYARMANIDEKITPYTMRHSFTQHLLAYGADVGVLHEMLGTKSLTLLHYHEQLSPKNLKYHYDQAHPRTIK